VKKSFGLIAAFTAVLFAVLLLPGCPTETEAEDDGKGGDSKGGNNSGGNSYNTDGAAMTWSGDWIRISATKYQCNRIGSDANTIERLTIAADNAGTVTIQISASSRNLHHYGYASKLDTGVSADDNVMKVSGTEVATNTYTIPSGSHWIQFMYQKDSYGTSGSDSVTVEIIASNFTSSTPDPADTTKLTISNQSSFTLADVKWGNTVISELLAESGSKTVDVSEGSAYLYFTKGGADGLKCRTQESITVTKDETTTFRIINNTVVVDLDNTANAGTLETIAPPASSASMIWSGAWTRVSDNRYTSNAIGYTGNTIERLDINASGAGTITIQISASCYILEYGYASKLDTGVSTSNYQMRVSGTQVATYTYNIPKGSHWIRFMYQKNGYSGSNSDNATVEIISTTFTTE
jgi:hypothetical protein